MRISFLTIVLVTILSGQCMAQRSGSTARGADEYIASVEILAYLSNGPSFLGSPEVFSFIELSSQKNLTDKFQKGVAKDVPFGTYVLEAGFTGFGRAYRVVRVMKKQVTVIIGLELRQEGVAFPTYARGRVNGALPKGRNFIKIVGIISSITEESAIANDGSFELSKLPDGEYMVMVVNENGLIASRKVEMPVDRLGIDLVRDRILP